MQPSYKVVRMEDSDKPYWTVRRREFEGGGYEYVIDSNYRETAKNAKDRLLAMISADLTSCQRRNIESKLRIIAQMEDELEILTSKISREIYATWDYVSRCKQEGQ